MSDMTNFNNDLDSSSQLSRRSLLVAAGGALLTASAVACDSDSPDPAGPDETSSPGAGMELEAPALAAQVEAGELPPLADRLPDNPLVVQPIDRVGQYGGEWNTVLLGPADTPWLGRTVGYEQLMRWSVDFTEAIPNIAESVEEADNGQTFTIHLRPGMKWSDGAPFTADDIVFWYNDVLLNEEYPSEAVPTSLTSGEDNVPATVEKIDDHTVQFSFAAPNGLFLQYLAAGGSMVGGPRHYLEQFHLTYNPDADQVASDEGFDSWVELFDAKSDTWGNPDLPALTPWTVVEPLGEGTRVVVERNPYYWKVDPDGHQLPYLDRVAFTVVSDAEAMLLMASSGEIDMHMRHFNNLANKPILAQSRESGDYEFFDVIRSTMNQAMISLNLTHKDETLRQVFQNKDFRIGLSHAINRDELIEVIHQRQGEPWQAAPRREADFFDEELAKQYTEFDVDEANRRLDQAGFTERDGDGFRLGPNGERIRFSIEISNHEPAWADTFDLIRRYWSEVGIDAQVRNEDRSLLTERKEANEHDAAVWFGSAGLQDGLFDPRCYLPTSGSFSDFATPWANWYNNAGEPQEEPPEAVKQQLEMYSELRQTVDREQQIEIMREILRVSVEEFYAMGTVLPVGDYGIVKNNFHNVPTTIIETGSLYPAPGPTNPEQYFVTES